MKVIGLDLSLTNTGVAIIEDGKLLYSGVVKSKPRGDKPIDELQRIVGIVTEVMALILNRKLYKTAGDPELVVIENLAFMAQGTSLTQLAGLSYLIRYFLTNVNSKFVLVAPSSLKKFITGKGNGDKNLVLMEVYKRYGLSFTNDNEADAFGLAQIGVALTNDKTQLIQPQQEVVDLIKKQL